MSTNVAPAGETELARACALIAKLVSELLKADRELARSKRRIRALEAALLIASRP